MVREAKSDYNVTRVESPRLAILALVALFFVWPLNLYSQGRPQHIKVLLETRQLGNVSSETLRGSGGVITRRGSPQLSGRLGAADRKTTVQRSDGIFTLVRDGGESILTVATRIPYNQITFYRDYATGVGYIARGVAFNEVGTSLKVSAIILPDNHVRLRLTPRVSYFSDDRPGIIDFTEAETEIVVPNGQPISFGGSTIKMHEITQQILGFADRTRISETSFIVTATIQ